jgi:hypothetical protein
MEAGGMGGYSISEYNTVRRTSLRTESECEGKVV